MRVAIVGVGLIGGSLGMALRAGRLANPVVGVGRNVESLDKALHLGAIDIAEADLAAGVAGADIVVLATPVPHILDTLARLRPLLGPDAVVTDVGSTKAEIVRTGDAQLPGHFVGGHPMTGLERSGVESARPELFQESTWAITPSTVTEEHALKRIRHFAQSVGARVVQLDPEAHDRAVAVTSHLPHILAYALSAVAGEHAASEPALYELSAGSFASGTRVAASSPELWRDIALSNRDALLAVLREYQGELSAAEAALAAGDADALLNSFARGYSARLSRP